MNILKQQMNYKKFKFYFKNTAKLDWTKRKEEERNLIVARKMLTNFRTSQVSQKSKNELNKSKMEKFYTYIDNISANICSLKISVD